MLVVNAPEVVSETGDDDNDFLSSAMLPVYGFGQGCFSWLDFLGLPFCLGPVQALLASAYVGFLLFRRCSHLTVLATRVKRQLSNITIKFL